MGFIYSTDLMNFNDIDWSFILDLPNVRVFNNAFLDVGPADYPVLDQTFFVQDGLVRWSTVPYIETRLGGYGFEFDGNGIATAGRLQFFALADYDTSDYMIVTHVNVSLTGLNQAALTPADLTDDQVMMRQILAGADTIVCSDLVATDDYIFAGAGNDIVFGNDGADTLMGDAGDDVLNGGRQSDWLVGGAGRDILRGGSGADRFRGGIGADTLYGGDDNARDVFIYKSGEEMSGSFSNDLIYDFVSGQDVIDLRQIDADTNTAGNQAFAFTGTVATANSLWYFYNSYNQHLYVLADLNGDTMGDVGLEFVGLTTLNGSEFLL